MIELFSFTADGWGDELVLGTVMTLAVAAAAFFSGVVFGTLGAAAKLSGKRVLIVAANVYTTVVRGVPELLVIYLLFFGGNGIVMALAGLFGYDGYIEINAFTIGALAVGLISGSYSTEVIRGAVQTIPPGQIEAARACGMRPVLILRRILVPQTLRYALPGLGNVWQLTLKDTALISVTSLSEIMRMSQVAAGSTHQPFIFYSAATVLYLILTLVSTAAFERAERFFMRGVRRAQG
jgi:octopine/nopaline transport system permease protein